MLFALGFSHWKRLPLRLCFSGRSVVFVSSLDAVPHGSTLVVWGARVPDGVEERALSVIRVEDGFLRSVGLGADLVRPVSWVVDEKGIYFDSTRASDLEFLLAQSEFGAELLARACALRRRVVALGLTKYNVGMQRWTKPAEKLHVVLVPGQVETDASLAWGAPGIRTNLELLRAARAACPDAYLIYKPHPDVVAQLRARSSADDVAKTYCDEVVVDVDMGQLLMQVDEVHVLTSLAGFEALLRGKRVVCHGLPFYAGWGLTQDMLAIERRTRRLSLDELVAGALILYPRYMSRHADALIEPEQALDELAAWHAAQAGRGLPWWRSVFRMVLRRVVGVR